MKELDYLLEELISENPKYSPHQILNNLGGKRKLFRILSNIRPPQPVSRLFLEMQDAELNQQVQEKGIIELHELPSNQQFSKLKLWQGDITRLRVDAIVNAANSQMLGCFSPLHGCIDNAIHSAAGVQLRLECHEIMQQQGFPEPTGTAKITKGYNLPAKHVIHTVGPIIHTDTPSIFEEQQLASCYQSCLQIADEQQLESIAFCCISTGEFRFPNQRAAEIAILTVLDYFEENPKSNIHAVVFNIFKDLDYSIYLQLLQEQKMNNDYSQRIEQAKNTIKDADFVIIGGGAGLSDAAGLKYDGQRFTENFKPFIEKYKFTDLYTSSFYPFKTEEERWAYWAKHISLNRYETPATQLYKDILKLVSEKEYFVITTNVESQFYKAGFHPEKIFAVQGDYGFLQCANGCHNKLYYNESLIINMLKNTINCKIPTALVPHCTVCGGSMEVNLRKDGYFVEDENWGVANTLYNNFVKKTVNGKMVLIELGVGFNTPGIIRYPFEQITFQNKQVTLIRINAQHAFSQAENDEKTILFSEDMSKTINDLH